MAPTPKELEQCNFRTPMMLLFQKIEAGDYPWLSEKFGRKELVGFLIDSSEGGFCVHLIMGWSTERRNHREVLCGDDFRKAVELSEPRMGVNIGEIGHIVNWGGRLGEKFYEQNWGRDRFFVLSHLSDVGKISDFSFKQLEEGLLRAAGRLLE